MTSLQGEFYRLRQLFVATDCWFVVFENVGYRKHVNIKMLCFAIQIFFIDISNS